MENIILSPGKYVQGNGAIGNLASHAGKKSLVIADDFVMNLTKEKISKSFSDKEIPVDFELFNGECSKVEISRIKDKIETFGSEIIIGVGGGKTLDTAKAVAYYTNLPVVIAPTIASTDAPCSALSVLYTEEGIFDEYLLLPNNPNIVLMDTDIISKAPARLLVSGMGDALATYFEARSCAQSNAKNMGGGLPTGAALTLAKLCYDTILKEGYMAYNSAQSKVSTKALENIVEANTYLSGVGFESGGLAAAHAIHNGLTILEDCHHLYHGEKVAFGTLVQLILENAPQEELFDVLNFCLSVGLPTNLGDMGVKEIDENLIMEVAKASCAPGETIHNMPFLVTPEKVFAAILTADRIGKEYR
ncbi:glycerol dehydrogenase [uncultured Ilyobacter sp.]|uniref:glycerol dehydrogenase n=1 Tax=uncultured Ilyobacter sp. TaxID=544433 RepID=UPI0029C0C0CD|nr:glycerol dehydrogenase [uncultured Ilyobacter sp.]